ncbi:hypothetical protein PCANC_12586 [Puccinia coronata f. sp. avenae]|uniref:Uncharacterized protein n=1 Tax=Puccinia coronata f. sp. avenae TaxID=200324 RepID=A0A2N5UMZ3_9BASI|nr:hypothetical protein PCANC_12586 [Puccinia coronata f. sp. avenae]
MGLSFRLLLPEHCCLIFPVSYLTCHIGKELVKEALRVMVFVRAHEETVKTAQMLKAKAMEEGILEFSDPTKQASFDSFERDLPASTNRKMKEMFQDGFGIHHTGIVYSNRTISERLLGADALWVLCRTATLALGVGACGHH